MKFIRDFRVHPKFSTGLAQPPVHLETGQPPVFIGPLLLHQKKDWKTYSRFANCLITKMPEIAALIASGIDGEKQLLMVFKEMRPMLYFLGALFITKEILRNI